MNISEKAAYEIHGNIMKVIRNVQSGNVPDYPPRETANIIDKHYAPTMAVLKELVEALDYACFSTWHEKQPKILKARAKAQKLLTGD